MKALWQAWYGLLDSKTCEELIIEGKKIPKTAGYIGNNHTVDTNIRDSEIAWVHHDNEGFRDLWKFVDQKFEEANANAFGVDTRICESMQFTTYHSQRKGHYNWHTDVFWESNNVMDRKLSMVIQLTRPEEYQGGELELDVLHGPDKDRLKEQGTVIVFPSFVQHRVLPVFAGTRHSLVVWKKGLPWR